MATAAVQLPSSVPESLPKAAPVYATEDKKQERHDVHTTLNFYKDNGDGSPPAPAYVNQPQTYDRPVDTHNVTIHDVSGHESDYTLDSHGFQFYRHTSEEKDFLDDSQIKDRYYKEVDQILKAATGATRTFIFDHTIRRQPQDVREPGSSNSSTSLRGPVRRVHIDQSYSAALSRVPHHLPSDASKLLKGRVQLINVWRPIRTVLRDPLTVAQSQSVHEEDLVPIGLIYPDRKGETLSVRHSERQKWFYKYRLSPEEVLLIKCFDNRAGEGTRFEGRAKRVPHSAFEVPGTEGEEGRESIEVRALVFTEGDVEE